MPKLIFTVVLLLLCTLPCHAELNWFWAFDTEAGTLTTNGSFEDTEGTFTFNINSFQVFDSIVEENIGIVYIETQPTQGFIWDGSMPTQFFRENGSIPTGANFFSEDFEVIYRLRIAPEMSLLLPDVIGIPPLASGLIMLVPDDLLFQGGFESNN